MNKRTILSLLGVSRERTAQIIREARDLMNADGKHWIQGDEKQQLYDVLKDSYIPNEYAYCSVGAIKEVAKTEEEMIAAYYVLNKNGLGTWPEIDETFINEYENYLEDGCDPHNALYDVIDNHKEYLEEEIINYNDADSTIWKNVKELFSRSAKALR